VRDGSLAPPVDEIQWAHAIAQRIDQVNQPSLRRVINATGVILHTNLGRAPLPSQAIAAIAATAGGGSNLEYDLATGKRGSRYSHCIELLTQLTGAEDALVVNNCAAALVLALNTCANGKEALISRGELIEIGGSFRVPDIMAQSGALLREVGTTNRTYAKDYRDNLSERAGAIVKVHRSNFEVSGFVADADVSELAPIAREAGVALIHDFGSGLLLSLESAGLHGEPTAREAVRAGASLVVMSGDKLMGGPQAGIILGARELVARCRKNPLTRALRVDKLTVAALGATLQLYRDPATAMREVPVLRMITEAAGEIAMRAQRIADQLASEGFDVAVVSTVATVGGGAYPSSRIPSHALAFSGDVQRMEEALRRTRVPVVGRIERDALLLDMRSVLPQDDAQLADSARLAFHMTAES
jgi:L-seryl-tRNA(Ser) seleniumtransferase